MQIISVSKFGSAAEWRARQGFVKSINTTWTFWTTRVVVVVVLTTGINVIHRRVESIVIFSDRLPGVVATKTRRKEMFSLIFPPHSLFPLSHSHSLAFNHWRRGLTIPRSRRRQGGRRQLLPVTKNSRRSSVAVSLPLPLAFTRLSTVELGRHRGSPGTPTIGTARSGVPGRVPERASAGTELYFYNK